MEEYTFSGANNDILRIFKICRFFSGKAFRTGTNTVIGKICKNREVINNHRF